MLGVLALLGAMVLPAMARVRGTASRVACADNLKQIGAAFNSWKVNHHDQFPMNVSSFQGGPPLGFYTLTSLAFSGNPAPYLYSVFGVMSNELATPRILICPSDERSPATNLTMHYATSNQVQASNSGNGAIDGDPAYFNNFKVSYFLGLSANAANPQMFLAGDRNIAGDHTVNNGFPAGVSLTSNNGYGNFCGTSYYMGTNWGSGTITVPTWTADKMHQSRGNVLLPDGSVQQLSSVTLRQQLSVTGDFTSAYNGVGPNTLLFP